LSPRKFSLICIATVIAVVVLAMAMVAMSPQDNSKGAQSATPSTQADAAEAIGYVSLSLGLSITIVADMGLMTLGLVILFKEETPDHYRIR
jgi:hypothetical protein